MGGLVQIVVITPSQQVIIKTLNTGKEGDFFFSQSFCDGDFEQCIKDFSQEENCLTSKEQGYNNFAPYNYGIVVIDFYHKKIHDMQRYNSVCYKSLSNYDIYINNKHIKQLIKNDKISLYHYETGEKHSLFKAFNTKNIHDIEKTIIKGFEDRTSDETKKLHEALSEFKNFNPALANDMMFDIMFGPSSLELSVNHYENTEIERLILNLIEDDIIFSDEDKKAWAYYVKDSDMINSQQINQLFERIDLNKKLNIEMSISEKTSLQTKI